MKLFAIGFLVATAVWLVVLNSIDIPEYTVIHKCLTV